MTRNVIVSFMLLVFLLSVFAVHIPSVDSNVNSGLGRIQQLSMSESSVDWWPMFRHDPTHTGYSTSQAPDTNQTLWSYTTGVGMLCWASPVVANGEVYVGTTNGYIYALNASTGTQIWNYTEYSGPLAEVYSSPAVSDGKVYVSARALGTHRGVTLALNASTGTYIWRYETYHYATSSPTVIDERVYVGIAGNETYALNASSGALIWNYTISDPGLGGCHSSPAVIGGIVFLGSSNGKVYALNASTGTQIWNYETGYSGVLGGVESSPAVAYGKVYVGASDGKLYALDAATGTEIWNYTWPLGVVFSSPAVANGKVYVGGGDRSVCAFNASTGRKIWNYTTSDLVHTSPAVADGKVYVSSYDGKFYALDTETGALIWSYSGAQWSSPAVSDGKVYAGSMDGEIHAFGTYMAQKPVAFLSATPTTITEGEIVTFNASASYDPHGSISSYWFDYGDGTNSGWVNNPIQSKTYSAKGEYLAKVKVKDNDGLESDWSNSVKITVLSNVLSIPYQEQGQTQWCALTSLAMVLKYYGYMVHNWNIAKALDKGHNDGPTYLDDWLPFLTGLCEYVESNFPALTTERHQYILNKEEALEKIEASISSSYPVLLGISKLGQGHMVVVTGYEVQESDTILYINDPSGALFTVLLKGKYDNIKSPWINAPVKWNDIKGISVLPISTTIVKGIPSPSHGSIFLYDESVTATHFEKSGEMRSVYTYLDHGLIWRTKNDHQLQLDSDDFLLIQSVVANHLTTSQEYEINVTINDEIGAIVYSYAEQLNLEPRSLGQPFRFFPLFNHLTKSGDYTIRLRLWKLNADHQNEQPYDEAILPLIHYEYKGTPSSHRTLFQDTIDSGDTKSYTLEVAPDQAKLSVILDWQGSDLDLHVYDMQGKHVGLNYTSGGLETQISSSEYSGMSTKPEQITILNPENGLYLIEVYGKIVETEKEQFSINATTETTQGPESAWYILAATVLISTLIIGIVLFRKIKRPKIAS